MTVSEAESRIILPNRRNFLAAAAAAATGLVATAQNSHGFLFRHSPSLDLRLLPKTWVALQGERQIQSYVRFLEELCLKYVDPLQIIQAHAKTQGSLWNTLPPRSMWRSMGGTLQAVDHVAAAIGQSVREVASAYRSPAYNRRCSGAKSSSWHLQNFALDLKFKASPGTVARAARSVRAKGVFKGGIGRYPSFVHIDTRGKNADW